MGAFPMMIVDLSVQTDWGRGLLRNSPVGDAIIGSPFAATDDNVFHTPTAPHTGQDFPCPAGIPVHDRLGGVCLNDGWDDAAGWWMQVRYPSGYFSFYCHLWTRGLFRAGDVVPPDAVIGYVDSTGARTTGDHLHWGLNTPAGELVDPMLYVGPGGLDFAVSTPPPAIPAPAPPPLYAAPDVEWLAAGWQDESFAPWRHRYPFRAKTLLPNPLVDLIPEGMGADGWYHFRLEIEDYPPGT